MRTPNYWIFTLLFWTGAGLLLFLQALSGDHWRMVVMRFMYLPILGLGLTAVMTLLFQSERFERVRWPAAWAIGTSMAAAVLTAIILNPITYLILGLDLAEDHLRKMTTGVYGFASTYLFWCVLYFELDGRPLLGARPAVAGTGEFLAQIEVDDRGEAVSVPVARIEAIGASGDYVHIHTPERSYLKKATITSMLAVLDPVRFRRVHRSAIVNGEHVTGTTPRAGGAFEITLASGRTIASSRSYRAVVQDLI